MTRVLPPFAIRGHSNLRRAEKRNEHALSPAVRTAGRRLAEGVLCTGIRSVPLDRTSIRRSRKEPNLS